MSDTPLLQSDLTALRRVARGKVRDVYEIGDDLLLVATDRVSAFDVVMARGIPGKGRVLTALSHFWFELLADVCPNHDLGIDVDAWDEVPADQRPQIRGRAMRCRRTRPLPIEWVVRGYLTGSGWKDYQSSGKVSGVTLATGLRHASRLDPAVLTPSTKAESGHDVPIAFHKVIDLIGRELAERCRDVALSLYDRGREHAKARGIVIADTKFEFGITDDGELLVIDECLTPDSSRFWPADEVVDGGKPTSFDKQVLRDHLLATGWDCSPPPPDLPDEVVERTANAYLDIERRLTAALPAR
jgi:phosphoribosylaminoimidazole-succinocarboxamide synthase